jgi:hypothetical protein
MQLGKAKRLNVSSIVRLVQEEVRKRPTVPADDTVDFDRNVVFGLDHLSGYVSELDLDVLIISVVRHDGSGIAKNARAARTTTRICSVQTFTLTNPGSTDL